jgi:HEAT repeat protein
MSADKYINKIESSEDVRRLILELKDKDSREIEEAVSAFGQIGEPLIVPLIDALKDEDKDIRFMAAKALEEIGNQAVEPLISVLGNNQSKVRVCAAETLGKIGNPKAIEPLIATLKDKEEEEIVREYAVYALERIGKPAVKSLVQALRDLKDPSAIAPLAAALYYNEQEVRQIAVELVSSLSSLYSTYNDVRSILERDHNNIPKATDSIYDASVRSKLINKTQSKRRFTQRSLTDFF